MQSEAEQQRVVRRHLLAATRAFPQLTFAEGMGKPLLVGRVSGVHVQLSVVAQDSRVLYCVWGAKGTHTAYEQSAAMTWPDLVSKVVEAVA